MNAPSALSLSGITKRFGSVVALEDAGIQVRPGTVHALLGENGAGKTTLMRIAFGLIRPDEGEIRLAGTPSQLASPARAIARGIGMVHQHFTSVPRMTVAENVALGGHGLFDGVGAERTVRDVGERTGLTLDPRARAEDLDVGAQQRLEIVKALARGARILILDEPTAVLAPSEARALLQWLRRFADAGGAVVLITHKLGEALAVTDDVTVLRRGRTFLSAAASAVTADEVARAMVGDAPMELLRVSPVVGDIVASANQLTLADRGAVTVREASFVIRAGEIVGVAAVEGSGQRELLRALAGRLLPLAGTLRLPDAIGFVPADRLRDALILDFSLTENVALRGAGGGKGRMRWHAIRSRTTDLVRTYDVRGGDAMTAARALSGGNQQKLVLARELEGDPTLVVAENPTRGLDIRASAAVIERLRRVAERGAAVVVHSTDLDEVISLATRMLVVHAGRVRETPVDHDLVGRTMLGLA